MPRDLDLRKLQAFGNEIVDIQAQAPDRLYVALAEGKIMVLDRLLVKHVLRCAQPILPYVSCVVLQKQKLFLLTHESSLRCGAFCSFCTLLRRHPAPSHAFISLVFGMATDCCAGLQCRGAEKRWRHSLAVEDRWLQRAAAC